ncbi:restriction endonuclease subunit S [Aeromonas salmonicida]|uniref:restriction endonuclease subunit S n=1 Tax=Aeromonas salmonicida TaxID=645 RepID=UPI000F79672C|nr:restriction endonuclease subunit S [Aeromonas salmonicida]RSM21340.1 restriction endonuclease subunit S [Aeromonas salmonicida]
MRIPDDWELIQLHQIAEKVMVGIASAATHAYSDSGIRMLRNLNIKEGWIDDSDMLHIDEEYERQHKNKRLKTGDILTVRTGYPGVSAVVSSKYDGAQCFTSLITRVCKKKAIPEYVCIFINSEYGKRFIISGEAGGAQKNVNAGILEKMPVPLPPLAEQMSIVKIISTWDKAITTTEQLLANSQQQKKALMQQLLTGQKRLLDNNGVRFSGDWKQVKLSKIFERVTTKNNGKSSNVVTISGQQGLIRQEDFFKKSVASDILDGYFLLMKGQFAYNKSYSNGYPMGAIKRLNRYADGVVTTLYICFEISESTKANGDFWEHYFESGLLNKGLSQIAHEGGRAHGLLNVKPTDFFSLKVPLPSLDEQQKIAAVLFTADQEISALQHKLDALKQEKKALMQQLLTGKRRVLL